MSLLNNYQVFMKWNRTFRINEKFPHPNTNIQNGYIYVPTFLEAFPKVKEMIRKLANSNLDSLSCENVQLQIRNHIIPAFYITYLEDCDVDDDPLTQEDFLHVFGLKMFV